MKNFGSRRIAPSEITDQMVWEQRRRFLKLALMAGVGAGVGPLSSGIANALAEGPGKNSRIANIRETSYGKGLQSTSYQNITSYNNFYEFGTSKESPAILAKSLRPRPWTVHVSGECNKPGEIGIEDVLGGFTQEERIYRFRCVEAWSMVIPWVGFPLADLLQRFEPRANAKYVAFETLNDPEQMPGVKRAVLDWPYREGLRMDEAMHPLTLIATGVYGEVLPNQNGAPLRLVVPWKYGFKSIKSIVGIRFTEKMPYATWWRRAPGEYGFYANVNPQVDHPRWSQKRHRVLGGGVFSGKEDTLPFNGYQEEVADLYRGMDLRKFF